MLHVAGKQRVQAGHGDKNPAEKSSSLGSSASPRSSGLKNMSPTSSWTRTEWSDSHTMGSSMSRHQKGLIPANTDDPFQVPWPAEAWCSLTAAFQLVVIHQTLVCVCVCVPVCMCEHVFMYSHVKENALGKQESSISSSFSCRPSSRRERSTECQRRL